MVSEQLGVETVFLRESEQEDIDVDREIRGDLALGSLRLAVIRLGVHVLVVGPGLVQEVAHEFEFLLAPDVRYAQHGLVHLI